MGGEVIDSIIVMNYRAAIKAFYGGGQLQLGVGASLAVGPLGRSANVAASASSTSHIAATYAYSASKGLFIGYSLEGAKISERVNTNAAFYGRPISVKEILTGQVPPPQEAGRLYDILNSLGAGPRPGLPFAPKKDRLSQQQSPYESPQQSPQQPQQSRPLQILPPPVNYSNRPPTTADGFEEPPPPYEPNDIQKSNLPTTNIDNHSTPFNQNFVNNNAASSSSSTGPYNDSKPPIHNNQSSSFNYYNNSNGKAPQQQQHPEFNRGTINATAVHHTGQNNSFYEPSSSTAPMLNKGMSQPQQQQYPVDVKKPLPEIKLAGTMTVVVAKYDYHSDSPADLSFNAGDHIIVTKRIDDRQSWWEGEIGEKRGFFPANYTDELTDD